jgi:hypothetical protein
MSVRSVPPVLVRSLVASLLLISVGCEPFTSPAPESADKILLSAITPNRGATGGGASVSITGSGFRRASYVVLGGQGWVLPRVTLGGIEVGGVTTVGGPNGTDWTTLYFRTPAHAAGTVDVAVTSPGGLPATLRAAYTYASPASFDFNGQWSAHLGGSEHANLTFTIRNDLLVMISCYTDSELDKTLTIASPTSTSSGEFSHSNLYARIVSANEAVGTIRFPPCEGSWVGGRREG